MKTKAKIASSANPLSYLKRRKNPLEMLPLGRLATGALIVAGVLFLLSLLAINFLPPEIPLFYLAGDPKEQIAPSWLITVPSILSIILVSANLLLAVVLKSSFVKRVLVVASVAIVFLATVSVFKIFFLVASY